ncbi:MAG: type II toxin-antitoxin system Phd/YefM family antitoxin [Nocardioidaceae bacterium]
MHEVPVTEARAEFSELINRVAYGGEPVVITRPRKPCSTSRPGAANPAVHSLWRHNGTTQRPADDQGAARGERPNCRPRRSPDIGMVAFHQQQMRTFRPPLENMPECKVQSGARSPSARLRLRATVAGRHTARYGASREVDSRSEHAARVCGAPGRAPDRHWVGAREA